MVEVHGHQGLVANFEDSLELVLSRVPHRLVDFFLTGWPRHHAGEVHQGDVDGGHADGESVQLAGEFRQHQAHGGSGAGLGGNLGLGGRAGAAQVFVVHVDQHLVVGVGVDGGHQAMDHADLFVQYLYQRRQAVGRAGGVGDHGVARLEHTVIHPVDHRGVHVLFPRSRDDDLLRSRGEMGRGLLLARKKAGALVHHIHVQFFPGQVCGVSYGEHADPITVHHHGVSVHLDLTRELAVHRIVTGEMGIGLGVAQVVYRHDLDVLAAGFVEGAQDVAADAAVAVDGDSDRHGNSPLAKAKTFILTQQSVRRPSSPFAASAVYVRADRSGGALAHSTDFTTFTTF